MGRRREGIDLGGIKLKELGRKGCAALGLASSAGL